MKLFSKYRAWRAARRQARKEADYQADFIRGYTETMDRIWNETKRIEPEEVLTTLLMIDTDKDTAYKRGAIAAAKSQITVKEMIREIRYQD